ncbi:MAG: hypothetical protein WEE36_08995 [Acidimicrobiia bacterium]
MLFLSWDTGIMTPMDDTPIEEDLASLEEADPADAPDLADNIAAELSALLESEEDDPATEA